MNKVNSRSVICVGLWEIKRVRKRGDCHTSSPLHLYIKGIFFLFLFLFVYSRYTIHYGSIKSTELWLFILWCNWSHSMELSKETQAKKLNIFYIHILLNVLSNNKLCPW